MSNVIVGDYKYRSDSRNVILKYLGNEEIWCFHPIIKFHVFSNTGKVKNLITNRILNTSPNSDGYPGINIVIPGIGRRFKLLHRLICESFLTYIGPNNYFYEVNHIDGNKINNNLSNLEWVTRDENLAHARNAGLYKPTNGNRKISDSDIEDMKELKSLGFTFKSISESYKCSSDHVSMLIRGKKQRKQTNFGVYI